jgi:hypothetical protein
LRRGGIEERRGTVQKKHIIITNGSFKNPGSPTRALSQELIIFLFNLELTIKHSPFMAN